MKKYKGTGLILILVMCFTVACGAKKEGMSAEGQTLNVALSQKVTSLDPTLATDIYSETVLRCMYTTLFDFDENLKLRPRLAKTVTQVDEKTWKIEIQDSAKFSDGTGITSDDVIFSIERAREAEKIKKYLEQIDSLEKIDDYSFYVRSKDGYMAFLDVFARIGTAVLPMDAVKSQGYNFAAPVTSGPFLLKTAESEKEIKLERVDSYYLGEAESQYLNFKVMETAQQRTSSLLNHEIDLISNVSTYDCASLEMTQGVTLFKNPSTKVEFITLNMEKAPFDDWKVRSAINMAINREKIARDVYFGYSFATNSMIPKGVLGYQEQVDIYDPEKARQLLKEAGHEEGFQMTVYSPYELDATRKNLLEYIKVDLAAVGISLVYEVKGIDDLTVLMDDNAYDAVLKSWTCNPDPDSMLPILFGSDSSRLMNASNYSNLQVDRWLEEGRKEEDIKKREEIYRNINGAITEDIPVIVLHNPMNICAAGSGVTGIHINAQGLFQLESLGKQP